MPWTGRTVSYMGPSTNPPPKKITNVHIWGVVEIVAAVAASCNSEYISVFEADVVGVPMADCSSQNALDNLGSQVPK